MKTVRYPAAATAVLDVTRAPYFLDPTGQRDCTEALIAILDDMLQVTIDGMKRLHDHLSADPSPDVRLPNSFENRKKDGLIWGIFPYTPPPSRILYFPKGTYLVSDTISYTFDKLKNSFGAELNWRIRFQGESREHTVIRLKDHAKGFGYGAGKAVVSFMRGDGSNVAMSNYVRNLTIDVGSGNPGAIALDFFGNNSAAVRDVTLRSSDPEGRGMIGLTVSRDRCSCCLFKNLRIEGFDYGVSLKCESYNLVLEQIELLGQRVRGMVIDGPIVSMRKIHSRNNLPAISCKGHNTHVVLLDSVLEGGAADAPAIEYRAGQIFLRNLRAGGYATAMGGLYSPGWGSPPIVSEKTVDEYCSHPPVVSPGNPSLRSLNFTVEDTPEIPWESDLSRWVHPGEYGAAGDGSTDDSAAIQAAMDSGKPVVFFQPGPYVINAPIRIPASVRQVNFLFADFIAGPDLRQQTGAGMFRVCGESSTPLLMEDLFSFECNCGEHYLVEHASTRTLILRDMHSQACAMYRNSVPGGTVFLENVASTTGVLDDTYDQPLFVFTGQNAWCRQLDPEYSTDKVINDGGRLFVLGFKTEGEGIAFTTCRGGASEILGGILLFGGNSNIPAALCDNSELSFVASTYGTTKNHLFKVAVREIRGKTVFDATHDAFPVRFGCQYAIPLCVGRSGKTPRPQAAALELEFA